MHCLSLISFLVILSLCRTQEPTTTAATTTSTTTTTATSTASTVHVIVAVSQTATVANTTKNATVVATVVVGPTKATKVGNSGHINQYGLSLPLIIATCLFASSF